jgi:hypothetical protein
MFALELAGAASVHEAGAIGALPPSPSQSVHRSADGRREGHGEGRRRRQEIDFAAVQIERGRNPWIDRALPACWQAVSDSLA